MKQNLLFVTLASGPAKYFGFLVGALQNSFDIHLVLSDVAKKHSGICEESVDFIEYGLDESCSSLEELRKWVTDNLFLEKMWDVIIVSAGWQTLIDKIVLEEASQRNIFTMGIVEHWSWYKERFLLNEKIVLPDCIIVNDKMAKTEAELAGLPSEKIWGLGNPVLENRWNNLPKSSQNLNNQHSRRTVLFLSEDYKKAFPSSSVSYQGFDEYQVLDDILSMIGREDILYIKLHPMEEKSKYNDLIQKYQNIKIIDADSLDTCALNVDFVIGMGSILLLEIALQRGDVISYRPKELVSFIGNKINATNGIIEKKKLQEVFEGKMQLNKKKWGGDFKGSTQRIVNFILERI